ncbi:SpoIIE family protein phosphatase [Breznakiellaceae bacterium SP9]
MKGLRVRFFFFFAGLSIAVSLIVGLSIYHHYSPSIERSYKDTMEKVSRILEVRYPALADPAYLVEQGMANSEEYWKVQRAMKDLAGAFEMDIHLHRRIDGKLQLLMSGSAVGSDDYDPLNKLAKRYDEAYIDPLIPLVYETKTLQVATAPYTNEYGTAVSGFRPLIKDGEVVSVLELDYDITNLEQLKWEAEKALLISLGIAVVLAFVLSLLLSRTLTLPIKELTEHALRIGAGDLTHKITIKGTDEIAELGTVLNKMTDDITEYISNLNQAAVEQERINNELSTAEDIQNGILPAVEPHFSNNHRFSLFARMQAAKSVGGDFYDFFYLDPEEAKIVLVMADVSGKGIPAALFMMLAKNLIKQQMLHSGDPSIALERVNRALCENNPRTMFVTVFICSIDLCTGQTLYANSGHNPPLLSEAGKPYKFLHVERGIPLGIFETSRYTMSFLQLHPGDKLYLYTDGINEAMNEDLEEFGNGRFSALANKNRNLPPEQFDDAIRGAVMLFSEGTEQSDDITSLAFHYTGQTALSLG